MKIVGVNNNAVTKNSKGEKSPGASTTEIDEIQLFQLSISEEKIPNIPSVDYIKIEKYNEYFPENQKILKEELTFILKQISTSNATPPIFIKKGISTKHSIVYFFAKDSKKWSLLIKPACYNVDKNKDIHIISRGGRKIIKLTGVLISFDSDIRNANANNILSESCRVITFSKSSEGHKNFNLLKNNLELRKVNEKEGYKFLSFIDANQNTRIIYYDRYKGEDLFELIRQNSLDIQGRISICNTIIKLLCEVKDNICKFNYSINDLKAENMVFDRETGILTIIDFIEETYTFRTKLYKECNNMDEKQQKIQKIYALVLVLYFVLNENRQKTIFEESCIISINENKLISVRGQLGIERGQAYLGKSSVEKILAAYKLDIAKFK